MHVFTDKELTDIARLLITGLFGVVAWAARSFLAEEPIKLGRFIGGLLGAWVASTSVVGLLHVVVAHPSVELLFGVAGTVGWIGGNVLGKIADLAEDYLRKRLGLDE